MASCSLGNEDVLDSGHALGGGRIPLQHNNSGNPVYLTGAKFFPSTVVLIHRRLLGSLGVLDVTMVFF